MKNGDKIDRNWVTKSAINGKDNNTIKKQILKNTNNWKVTEKKCDYL